MSKRTMSKRTMSKRSMRGAAVFGWVLGFAGLGGCAIHLGRKDPEPEQPQYLPPEAPTTPATTVAKVSGTGSSPSATPAPTTAPTSRPTSVPTSRPTSVPTSRPTGVPTTTPSTSPSGVPSSPGDGWALSGGTGNPVATGECTGCKGACGDEEEGPRQIWNAQLSEGKLVAFSVVIIGASDPIELSRDDLSEVVKDGATVTFKVPKEPPNGEVKLHVVGDKAEVKLGSDLIPGACNWEEPTPEPMD